jgi:hypothetical protein
MHIPTAIHRGAQPLCRGGLPGGALATAFTVKLATGPARPLYSSRVGLSWFTGSWNSCRLALGTEEGECPNPVRHGICAFQQTPRKGCCALLIRAHNRRHGRQEP